MSVARMVYDAGLVSGELETFNRLAGGGVVNYLPVSSNTVVKSGNGIFYGVLVTAPTAVANINFRDTTTSNTANILLRLPAASSGFTYRLPVGMIFNTGLMVHYQASATGNVTVLYV